MPASPTIIVNLTMRIGEDKSFVDTIYQSNGTTPQDITGWSVSFIIHKYGDPTTVFVLKTVGAGIVLTTPLSGILTATVLNADTVGMLTDQYEFYIARTDAGNYAVLSRGLFTLQPD